MRAVISPKFAGSVLSVWTRVESVLTNDGQKKGQHAKMQVSHLSQSIVLRTLTTSVQVVRMRLEEGRRIVGTLIPGSAMDQLIKTLGQGAEESEEVIH